jgi:hypothetical protein
LQGPGGDGIARKKTATYRNQNTHQRSKRDN